MTDQEMIEYRQGIERRIKNRRRQYKHDRELEIKNPKFWDLTNLLLCIFLVGLIITMLLIGCRAL